MVAQGCAASGLNCRRNRTTTQQHCIANPLLSLNQFSQRLLLLEGNKQSSGQLLCIVTVNPRLLCSCVLSPYVTYLVLLQSSLLLDQHLLLTLQHRQTDLGVGQGRGGLLSCGLEQRRTRYGGIHLVKCED
jgi:hypothetical protein